MCWLIQWYICRMKYYAGIKNGMENIHRCFTKFRVSNASKLHLCMEKLVCVCAYVCACKNVNSDYIG